MDKSRQVDFGGQDVIVDTLAFSSTTGQNPSRVFDITGNVAPLIVSTTSATLTTANLLSAMIICTNAGATTVTVDTAANVVAALNLLGSGCQVGDTISFDVSSGSANAGGVTIAANASGGTLNAGSSAAIATLTQKTVLLRITGVSTPAYTLYM